jgi:hypothetical protein
LDLSTSLASGINYFGFWLSALDSGNIVTFLRSGLPVFEFTPTNLISLLGACPNALNAFCGNPNPPFLGGNAGELYAFLNFTDDSGTFDRIVFTENPTVGGYESDNHTVGFVTGSSGTPIPTPEPMTAALLGAGLAGFALSKGYRRTWRHSDGMQ